MGSAFHQLCPRYSGALTPTAPKAIRLRETFTFTVASPPSGPATPTAARTRFKCQKCDIEHLRFYFSGIMPHVTALTRYPQSGPEVIKKSRSTFPVHKCENANNCWYFNNYEQEKTIIGLPEPEKS